MRDGFGHCKTCAFNVGIIRLGDVSGSQMFLLSLCAQRCVTGCLGRKVNRCDGGELNDKRTGRGVGVLFGIGCSNGDEDEALRKLKDVATYCSSDEMKLSEKGEVLRECIRAKTCIGIWQTVKEKRMISEECLELLKECSERDVFAVTTLGYCYDNGYGVSKDKKKAIEFYERASSLGHTGAMNKLGNCYFKGDGVDEDKKKAIEFYERASSLGYAQAINNLGNFYLKNGDGVDEDKKKAIEYYERASSLGYE